HALILRSVTPGRTSDGVSTRRARFALAARRPREGRQRDDGVTGAAARARRRAAVRRRIVAAVAAARTDTGLRQDQLDARRAGRVGNESAGDRADLFVAGEHEERRRSAVALHPGDVEILLRMRELARAVRRDGAAAMDI